MKIPYSPAPSRHDGMPYRRCGHNGLSLPALSLGLWQGFGDNASTLQHRELLTTAFDLGITHFDLANNYGPPSGSAELHFGRVLREDLRAWRDEITISTKAGGRMWPGPHGAGGASRKHLLASLDQSLRRLQTDYVDIFLAHRPDPDTPLAETAAALATAVRQGKALYVGVSGYGPEAALTLGQLLEREGVRMLMHEASYSLLNRSAENGLLDACESQGVGCITVSALAEGVLTNRYLADLARQELDEAGVTVGGQVPMMGQLKRLRSLYYLAKQRGQTLSQLALAWVLRDARVTSAAFAATHPSQVREAVAALRNLHFSADEIVELDHYAPNTGRDPWRRAATLDKPPLRA
ncbi:aldo/keto reductase [Ideonella livida]|uniref:L-glyceraldehyde 3-phosphate reductase n=1 Tax=Ideonella livida TaxID=2707176 RepID=A0A7C9PK09_9BURK|nr:aldo/keto reductase [Ideonella livida]NDY93853.1 L-glyceraldehyde 3-phosphate reductase [Ideonella livida]